MGWGGRGSLFHSVIAEERVEALDTNLSVADRWDQHPRGRCKSNELWQIGEKGTPWHFWEDKSRLTEVPTTSLCETTGTFALTPLVLNPFVPFQNNHNNNTNTYTLLPYATTTTTTTTTTTN